MPPQTMAPPAFGSGKSRLLTQDPGNSWADPAAGGKGKTRPMALGKGKSPTTSTGSTSSSMMPPAPELTNYNDQWSMITEVVNEIVTDMPTGSTPGPTGSTPGWAVGGAAGAAEEETPFDETSAMERVGAAMAAMISGDPVKIAEVQRRLNRNYPREPANGTVLQRAQEAAMRAARGAMEHVFAEEDSEGLAGVGAREAEPPVATGTWDAPEGVQDGDGPAHG